MDPLVNLKKDFTIALEQLKMTAKESEEYQQLALNSQRQVEWAKREAEEIYNQTVADAEYRQWRAKVINEALAQDPKLSEWKIKAMIEQSEDFVKQKQLIAKSQMESSFYGRLVGALHDQAETVRFLLNREPTIEGPSKKG